MEAKTCFLHGVSVTHTNTSDGVIFYTYLIGSLLCWSSWFKWFVDTLRWSGSRYEVAYFIDKDLNDRFFRSFWWQCYCFFFRVDIFRGWKGREGEFLVIIILFSAKKGWVLLTFDNYLSWWTLLRWRRVTSRLRTGSSKNMAWRFSMKICRIWFKQQRGLISVKRPSRTEIKTDRSNQIMKYLFLENWRFSIGCLCSTPMCTLLTSRIMYILIDSGRAAAGEDAEYFQEKE